MSPQTLKQAFLMDAVRQFLEAHDRRQPTEGLIRYMRRCHDDLKADPQFATETDRLLEASKDIPF